MDCGTGGLLDKVCIEEGVNRLPGAHCYELFSGSSRFTAWQDAEPGTFYLTDYLVKHFDRIVMQGLGISKHPELLQTYFGNYTRVLHLAQSNDPSLTERATIAADQLGLPCKRVFTGLNELNKQVFTGLNELKTRILDTGNNELKTRSTCDTTTAKPVSEHYVTSRDTRRLPRNEKVRA